MQEISLIQGIMLSIMAIVIGFDFWIEALFIFRPIIVCTLTGLILGDLQLGLIAGGLTELAFAGLTPVGGTQPPNPVLAGVMTTVIAYTTNVEPVVAIGLALPFSFLMQYIILFYYSTFSVFMSKADQLAKKADMSGFAKLNLVTIFIVGITYGVVVFLCTYVAQEPMKLLVENFPPALEHGLGIAGGILPAVGFGLLLKVMLKSNLVPFLIAGFLYATYNSFANLLPVALLGAAMAIFVYFNDKQKVAASTGGNVNEGI